MSGFSWDSPYLGESFNMGKLIQAKAIIRKYAFIYDLNAKSTKELEDAYKEIEKQRSLCFHDYVESILFTSVDQVCNKCGHKKN